MTKLLNGHGIVLDFTHRRDRGRARELLRPRKYRLVGACGQTRSPESGWGGGSDGGGIFDVDCRVDRNFPYFTWFPSDFLDFSRTVGSRSRSKHRQGNSLYNSIPECESPKFMHNAWLVGAMSKLPITHRRIGMHRTSMFHFRPTLRSTVVILTETVIL